MVKDDIQSQSVDFESGPVIDEAIVEWLNDNASNRVLQLPIEIEGSSVQITATWLRAGNTKIEIKLDRSAMSVDLPVYLRRTCKSYPCRIWLEGTWGPLISIVPPGSLPVFTVHKVKGLTDEEDLNVRFPKKTTLKQ